MMAESTMIFCSRSYLWVPWQKVRMRWVEVRCSEGRMCRQVTQPRAPLAAPQKLSQGWC